MKVPNNFSAALSHHLDGWNATYHYWHPYQNEFTWKGKYNLVGTFNRISQLERFLSNDKWDVYQHYISVYSYKNTIPDDRYVNGIRVDEKTPIINKIYGDLDPKKDETEPAWYHLSKLQKMQKDVPCNIIFTGRGFQFYIYLDRETDLKTIKTLRDIIVKKYDLELDPNGSPITNLRVFRLPYTKNIKNNRWTFPVLPRMTIETIDRFSSKSELEYCFYNDREIVNLDKLKENLCQ